jgi:predicted RNA polymerase sigma factor
MAAPARGPAGPYQLQAAIAAVHDEAPAVAYLAAAERTSNLPQQRYLYARAARLADDT